MIFSWFQNIPSQNRDVSDDNDENDDGQDEPTLVELLHPHSRTSSRSGSAQSIDDCDSSYWKTVVDRARKQPYELQLRGIGDKETALFMAIQGDAPPFVIEEFLQLYPAAARDVQRIGLTALHLAVARGLAPQAIAAILQAWPQAAQKKMTDGCVALHFARDLETARLLLKVYPEAIYVANNADYLPLHRLIYASYAGPELVQLLVDAEINMMDNLNNQLKNHHAYYYYYGNYYLQQRKKNQLFARTWNGITPLDAACDMLERELKSCEVKSRTTRTGRSYRTRSTTRAASAATTTTTQVCPLKWKKLEIVARAAYHQEIQTWRPLSLSRATKDYSQEIILGTFCILHALVLFDCPTSIIQYTLDKYPEQRMQMDEHGRTPLSIAAARRETPSSVIQLLLRVDRASHHDSIGNHEHRSDEGDHDNMQPNESDATTAALTKDVTCGGRFPLHIAVASRRSFDKGMDAIFKAAPTVLLLPDPITRLCPPVLAAMADKGRCKSSSTTTNIPSRAASLAQLRTIYSLLREAPWLIPQTTSSTSAATTMTTTTPLSKDRFGGDILQGIISSTVFQPFGILMVLAYAVLVHALLSTLRGNFDASIVILWASSWVLGLISGALADWKK